MLKPPLVKPSSYTLEYPEYPRPVGATFTFSRAQVAALLKKLDGQGQCAGAWPLLRDAGADMSLHRDGEDF